MSIEYRLRKLEGANRENGRAVVVRPDELVSARGRRVVIVPQKMSVADWIASVSREREA